VLPGGSNPQCDTAEISRITAIFTLILNITVGILSAYTAPKLGSLSDRYGRKRLMVICSMGGLVGEVITLLAAKYPDSVDYRWMVLGSFFDGLSGSFTAGSVLSHSYTSDCTPPSKRSVAIGYLFACLFSGMAFGPLIAAQLVEWTGSLLSIFYIALACHIIFILCVFFVIPESLSKRRQHLAREKFAKQQEAELLHFESLMDPSSSRLSKGLRRTWRVVKKANIFAPLKMLAPPGRAAAPVRRNLISLALIDMIVLGTALAAGTVVILYSRMTFGWQTPETSRFVSLVSMVRFFALMAIFPLINYFFRTLPAAKKRRTSSVPVVEKNAGADMVDIWVLRFALLSDVIGVTGYIFAATEILFISCGIITAFGGLGSATIQSAITKHVPPERVGELLGAIGLLHALSRVVAPLIFNGIYALTVERFPQAIFVTMTSLFALVLAASFLLRPNSKLQTLSLLPGVMCRKLTRISRSLSEG
jgi:MFS family permease